MKLDSLHNSFSSSIEGVKGVGKLWSSQPFTWNITNKFEVPAVIYRNYKGMRTKKYEDTQWHLKATNNEKQAQLRFLSVIQVGKEGTALPFKESKNPNGSTRITIGDWQIDAMLQYNQAPQLQIQSVLAKTVFAAYGDEIKFLGQTYKGTATGSSKLAELVNGRVKFSETADQPLPPIR